MIIVTGRYVLLGEVVRPGISAVAGRTRVALTLLTFVALGSRAPLPPSLWLADDTIMQIERTLTDRAGTRQLATGFALHPYSAAGARCWSR